jgi:hypothetical protein
MAIAATSIILRPFQRSATNIPLRSNALSHDSSHRPSLAAFLARNHTKPSFQSIQARMEQVIKEWEP